MCNTCRKFQPSRFVQSTDKVVIKSEMSANTAFKHEPIHSGINTVQAYISNRLMCES